MCDKIPCFIDNFNEQIGKHKLKWKDSKLNSLEHKKNETSSNK